MEAKARAAGRHAVLLRSQRKGDHTELIISPCLLGLDFLPVLDGGCIVVTVQPACTFGNHIRVRDVIVVTLDGRRVFREQDFAGQERERVLQVAHTRTLRAALDRSGPLPRTLTVIKNACC